MSASPSNLRSRTLLLAVYAVAAFTTVLNITMMSPLLLPIAEEFARSEARAGQLSTITAGFAFGTALLVAPLLDRYPRRVWLRAQVGLVAGAALLTAVSSTFAMVMVGRALAGIGGAIIIGICYASAAENFGDGAQRHRVVGLIASSTTLGSILGLPVLTWLADTAGWRWAVLVIMPLSLLVLAGAGQLRESPSLTQANAAQNWARAYRSILAQQAVMRMLGAMVLILVARFGWFIYLGAYAEKSLNASAATLGIVFAVGGAGHMLGSNLVPGLLARFSARGLVTGAAIILGLDLATVGLYSGEPWSMFPFVGIFSICWAICFVTSSIYLLDLAPAARSAVSALQSAAMELGIALGAALGGVLLSALDDYERMFRSLALVIPVALVLFVASIAAPVSRTDAPAPAESPA